jgi:UDP-N-acetylmuramoyl-tripeptide--D-alanyl-D-alanine ligase
MLQASEYDVTDFFRWHERVNDFRAVEKRKHLVFTSKALMLFVSGWVTIVVLVCAVIVAFFSYPSPWNLLLSAVLLIEFPVFVLFSILFVLLLSQFLQKPMEALIVREAKRTIATHPALKIAIAGSFGKTSMREIVKTVLSEGKNVAAPVGSYNTPLGIAQFVKTLKGDESVLVFELGEYYSGDIKNLCDVVQPDIGIITGVNEAHLEKFKSLDNATKTIFELADYLGEKPTYVSADNAAAYKAARQSHILYSHEGGNGWVVSDARTSLEGTSCTLTRGESVVHVRSKLLGLHQIGAFVVATDIAVRLGLSCAQIESGFAKTTPFEHRLEPKFGTDGVVTLDDSYNGNPDGVRAVIEFLGALPGRTWYVTPGLVEMGSRKEEVHRTIGTQLVKNGIEKVVLIRNSVTPFIYDGLKSADYKGDVIWFDDALAAFSALPRMTVKGDIVLLQNDWPDQYA